MTHFVELNNGLKMPRIGLGTWNMGPGVVEKAVKAALNNGYRLLDCAKAYENQKEIGHALREVFTEGRIQRKDVFIITKVWNTFHSYELTKKSVDDMLAEMQLDYFDLLLIHWPQGYEERRELFPMEPDGEHMRFSNVDYLETWKAMEEAVQAKKVLTIGLSNFNHKQIQKIIDNAEIKPAVLQIELHPYFQQKKLRAFCKEKNIVITAYSSLGNPGMPFFRKKSDPNILDDPVIINIGAAHSKSPAQVALRWAIQHNLSIMPKSSSEKRIRENFDIFNFTLSDEEMKQIDALDRDWRIISLARDSDHKYYPFREEY